MFATIEAHNLGPIVKVSLALNEAGVTTLEGGSEAGKSSIMDATCILITGKDSQGETPDNIKDGADAYRLEGTTGKGTVFARTRNRKGDCVRTKQPKGGELSAFASEAAWLDSHVKFTGSGDLTRCIVVSRAWETLAEKDLGRPLRDIIKALLPPGDLRGTIAAMCELRAPDPLDEAGAKALATATNKARDEAKGALDSAKVPPTLGDEPEVGDAKAADTVIATALSWVDYKTKMVGFDAAKARIAEQVAARDAHKAKIAALGKRPAFDADSYRKWEAEAKASGDAMQAAIRARGKAEDDLGNAKESLARLEGEYLTAQAAGDKCPTCDRAGWQQAAAALADLKAKGLAATAALTKAESDYKSACDTENDAIAHHTDVSAKGEAFVAAREALGKFDAELKGLGTEPGVQGAPDAPVAPFRVAPSDAEVTAAKATKEAAIKLATIREANARAVTIHADHLAKSEARYTAANAEADRVTKVLKAVREAPSKILKDQEAALGDFGPVTFEFPTKATKTTPEIVVKIDGRDWRRASTGRRIYASARLQIRLRELAKLPYLPIFIDEVQSYSGDWGTLPARVVMMRTTTGPVRVVE